MRTVALLTCGALAGAVVGALLAGGAAPHRAPPVAAVPGEPPPTRLQRIEARTVDGKIAAPGGVSGVAPLGELLLLVSDNTSRIEVLRRTARGYEIGDPVALGGPDENLDLEALAVSGETVYAVGSHSRARPKLRAKDAHAEARDKLTRIEHHPAYDGLFRFRLTADGAAAGVERASLRPAISADPTLAPFAALPGKENGVDVEGLAVKGDRLFVGFRGPVLRGGYVPVMVTAFGAATGELRFVNLGGRGVRDLAAVASGFLILAGPTGEGPGSFQLYWWDGDDCLPGAAPAGTCDLVAEVAAADGEKPEGVGVLAESDSAYDLLLVCDGPRNGVPTHYRLFKR